MFRLTRTLAIVGVSLSLLGPITGCGSALSSEQEVAIGQQAAPKFLHEGGGEIPDPQVRQYVADVGRRLVAKLSAEERRGLSFEFHTLDSSVINAFALPGGHVFITRALLGKLETEAQLAGVLGHEVGHVTAEHIGEQIRRQQVAQVLTGAAGVVTDSGAAQMGMRVLGAGVLLKFSRTQELEADRLGMDYMYRAGYKPGQMRKVMRVLKEAGGRGGIEMLQTHPDPDRRLGQANDLVKSIYSDTVKNLAYIDNAQAYRDNVLSRLQKLPPPRHKG